MKLLTLLLLLPFYLFGAEKYYRQGASGSGSGNNWTDAYTDWSTAYGAVNRGDTLWVADTSTSIGTVLLNKPLSGTTPLTIKKATVANHGTSTGWNNSFGDGQAVFGSITVATPYHIIDGSTRTETFDHSPPSGYGIRATSVGADSLSGQNASFSEFRYLHLGGEWNPSPSAATIATYDRAARFVYNQTDVLFHRCAMINAMGFGVHGGNRFTIEYCFFAHNFSKAFIQGPNAGFNNFVIRYNRFLNSTQTDPNDSTSGLTCEAGVYGPDLNPTGNEIYGNTFTGTAPVSGRNGVLIFAGAFANSQAYNHKVFNNTFANIVESSAVADIMLFGGSGNEARNNLFYNTGSQTISANSISHNVTASSNPFVDYNNGDFRLTAPTVAGTTLAAAYNTDPSGATRGADGVWDVGAYEFGGTPPTPDPPIITSIDHTATNGIATSYQITMGNVGGATTFFATNLPSGLTCGEATGTITGMPNLTVTNSVILVAINTAGSTNKTVTFTIWPPQPALALSTASLSFGPQQTNTISDATFWVTNAGTAGSTLAGSVSNASAPWSITTTPATYSLASGAGKQFTLRCSPTAIGSQTGTVALNGNHASNYVALSSMAYPVFASTNWQITNALILPAMAKGASYLYVTNEQLAPPNAYNTMAIWAYNQEAQTTGTLWGKFIATNLSGGSTIAFGAAADEYKNNVVTGETTPLTQGTLTDGYVVGMVAAWSAGGYTTTGASYDGEAMQLLSEHNLAYYGQYRVQIYGRAIGSKAAGTYNFSVTTDGTITEYNAGVMTFSNVKQSDTVGTAVDGVGTNTTASLTVASATGELVLMALVTGFVTLAPNSGETEWVDTYAEAQAVGGPYHDILWGGSEPGAASVQIAADFGGSQTYCATAIPIRATTNYGANSLYFQVNTLTTFSTNLVTILPKATNWDTRTLSQVGTGTLSAPQYWTNDAKWVLGPTSVFYLTTRETDTWIRELNYTPDAEAGADETAPVVTIQSPTNGAVIAVTTTPLTTLSGVASDNVAITSMTATNNTTGYAVTGTTAWSVGSITLSEGTNTVSVYASDGANVGSDTVTVIYTAPIVPGPAAPFAVSNLNVKTLRVE